mmetsp:Transcript_58056/g.155454  ORF Transcript_58056/g.155454 Transcript_58056/m.155454 type:complete len:134 (-) Transcript_58056:83-484(-)
MCTWMSCCKSKKPKTTAGLTQPTKDKLEELFGKMDLDKSGDINLKEAVSFWGQNFAKVNAAAFFNEVDTNENTSISLPEYIGFWANVKKNGYTEDEILEEVENMLSGGSWVDWKDGRTTDKSAGGKRNSLSKC